MVSGKKFARVLFMCMCVCDGVHLPRKEGTVKILHRIDIPTQNSKMVKGKTTAKQH